MRGGPKAHDPPFAAEQGIARGERDFEAQDDALGSRLGAKESDGRPRERIELVAQEFVLGPVRTRDADRDRCARVVSHADRIAANRPHVKIHGEGGGSGRKGRRVALAREKARTSGLVLLIPKW